MRKYNSIDRFGKRGTEEAITTGSHIAISEKLDGANSSVKFEDGKIRSFSRNTELSEQETLRGFYQWANEHFIKQNREDGLILYGEWLCQHKLHYGDNKDKFYLFDVYDTNTEEYLALCDVEQIASNYDLLIAPIFYEGKYQSIEHIQSFVGKSELGDVGEGIVVKDYTYRDRFGEQAFVKFVSDAFAEKMKTKKHKVKSDPLTEFIKSTLTDARISKILHKLVDEGVLHEEYGIEDMGVILKGIGSELYDDIIKEELEDLLKIVKQQVGRNIPNAVKEVLANEGKL